MTDHMAQNCSEISCRLQGNIDRFAIDEIVTSYLFELSASCHYTFEKHARHDDRDINGVYDESSDALLKRGECLRPLATGPGMGAVEDVFLRAAGASEPRHGIVDYAQVVEYVSATAARIDKFAALRLKLLSPRSLQPDSAYLAELKALVEGQRAWIKDAHAMKMTLRICGDATELRAVAPDFCALAKLSEDATSKALEAALDDLADRITATRNALSHAKANYTAIGLECPPERYHDFASLCRCVAEQAIRWFALQDASLRVA